MAFRRLSAALALLVCLGGCQKARPQMFAFLDENDLSSIYDVDRRRIVWQSELPAPWLAGPSWSNGGRFLAYACHRPEGGEQYVGVLDTISMQSRIIAIGQTSYVFEGSANWEWSPSERYLLAYGTGYPQLPAIVVDTLNGILVGQLATAGPVVWSQDESSFCYVHWCGPADIAMAYEELLTLNVESRQETMVFTGEMGRSVVPLGWTKDGAVVFKYSTPSDIQFLDTKGRQYSGAGEFTAARPSVPRPPDALWQPLEQRTGWSQNKDGDWLIGGREKGGAHWILLAPHGSTTTAQLVKGKCPGWKPTGR